MRIIDCQGWFAWARWSDAPERTWVILMFPCFRIYVQSILRLSVNFLCLFEVSAQRRFANFDCWFQTRMEKSGSLQFKLYITNINTSVQISWHWLSNKAHHDPNPDVNWSDDPTNRVLTLSVAEWKNALLFYQVQHHPEIVLLKLFICCWTNVLLELHIVQQESFLGGFCPILCVKSSAQEQGCEQA